MCADAVLVPRLNVRRRRAPARAGRSVSTCARPMPRECRPRAGARRDRRFIERNLPNSMWPSWHALLRRPPAPAPEQSRSSRRWRRSSSAPCASSTRPCRPRRAPRAPRNCARCAAWRWRSPAREPLPSRWPTPIPATSSSTATGIAWFVDLEKVHVGSPAIDLAHATAADLDGWAIPRCRQVAPVTRTRCRLLRPCTLAHRSARAGRGRCEPWLVPMRAAHLAAHHACSWRAGGCRHAARAIRTPHNGAMPGSSPAMKAHIDARIDSMLQARDDPRIHPDQRMAWLDSFPVCSQSLGP